MLSIKFSSYSLALTRSTPLAAFLRMSRQQSRRKLSSINNRLPGGSSFLSFVSAKESVGPPKFLTPSLHACHALRWTPADPRKPHHCGLSVLASDTVNTVAIRIKRHNGAVSSLGERGLSCGLHASLCTLQLTRSVFPPPQSQLQHSVGVDG